MTDQLRILQHTELEIAKEFHRICQENNLRYILAFGTMIGCIRHKGFIPWDDDIDVVMPWEDYCKFNEIANLSASSSYMLQNHKTVENHVYPFSRFVKKNSCAIIEYPFKNYFNQAIYIDIFPALYVPKGRFKYRKIQLSNFVYSQTGRMTSSGPYRHTKRNIVAKAGMFMFYCLNKLLPRQFCYPRMFRNALSISLDQASAFYIGDLYSEVNAIGQFQMPLDVFDNRILLPFEDTEFYMPKDYDMILRRMYGDYMILPPEEKRKSHGFKFVSDTMSYQKYDELHKNNRISSN